MGYDEWLQEPYQEACEEQERYDLAEENFCDSDEYYEQYQDWVDSGNTGSEADWEETQDYVSSVQSYSDRLFGGGRDE